MQLKVTGKTNTTGTKKDANEETVDIDYTNYSLESAGGSVKVRVRCENGDALQAAEDDEFELKQVKTQTRLAEPEQPKKRGRPPKGK